MTTQDAVNMAAAGEPSPVILYWDDQDPANEGPAYRYADGSDSGSLEVGEWTGGDPGSLFVGEFFDCDGSYYGPDEDGLRPSFIA